MTNVPSYPVSTIAKLFDVTERRVQQLASDGVIPKATRGRYELVGSVQGYVKFLKERSTARDNNSNSSAIERTRLIKIQADKLELELLKANKDLLPKKQVTNLLQNIVNRCKSVLLTIPSKLAAQVIGLNDPRDAEIQIKEFIDEALSELSVGGGESDIIDNDKNN